MFPTISIDLGALFYSKLPQNESFYDRSRETPKTFGAFDWSFSPMYGFRWAVRWKAVNRRHRDDGQPDNVATRVRAKGFLISLFCVGARVGGLYLMCRGR